MAVIVTEALDSQQSNIGTGDGSYTRRYLASGSTDMLAVHAAVATAAGLTYGGLPRLSISVWPVFVDTVGGVGRWKAEVVFSIMAATNEPEYNFDTTGGNQHLTQSISTTARYAPAGATAPNFKGAIGVTDKSVEGTDVPVSVYTFSETHYFSSISDAYKIALANLTARWNAASFRGFAAGEVLFLGCRGGKRGTGPWCITFLFARSPNVTNLTVGDITVAAKLGWDYLWTQYEMGVDATAKAYVRIPKSCHVERVLYSGDFSGLGIS